MRVNLLSCLWIPTAAVKHCKHSFLPNRCPEIHLTSLFWTDIQYGLKIKHPALSLSPWVYLDRPPFKLPSPLNPIMNIKAGHKANCQLERSLKLSLTPHNNDIHLKLWQKTNNGINAGCLGILFNRRIARGKITGTSQWTAIFLLLSCTNALKESANIKAGRGKTSWSLWTIYKHVLSVNIDACQTVGKEQCILVETLHWLLLFLHRDDY